ncbi:hypothetical protein [Insulibacter thermoxylanivorax]|uniref:hypothetical protein n=1 Tax=Insulibacter thermoxylanivorax TaxID=2749268 RepID=UPI0019105A9C|nr:hypothetical protein [Insulibacter thermoxylanivorax]
MSMLRPIAVPVPPFGGGEVYAAKTKTSGVDGSTRTRARGLADRPCREHMPQRPTGSPLPRRRAVIS